MKEGWASLTVHFLSFSAGQFVIADTIECGTEQQEYLHD